MSIRASTVTVNQAAGTGRKEATAIIASRKEEEWKYEFDPKVAEKAGVYPNSSTTEGQVTTSNNRGFQMSTKSELFESWVSGFNGKEPIADIGAAYGLNTLSAIALHNVPVVAIDMTRSHLDYVQEHYNQHVLHNNNTGKKKDDVVAALTVVESRLPELAGVENESISSLLVAEVVHFLSPTELPIAFQRFHDVLVSGGVLNLTAVHTSGGAFDPTIGESIQRNKERGSAWPGWMDGVEQENIFKVWFSKISQDKSAKPIMDDVAFKQASCERLHYFSVWQIAKLAEDAGFIVKQVRAARHPGYMSSVRSDHSNIQLVAIKP